MTSRRELKNYAKQAMSGKYGILILAFVAVQALALISSMISSALFPGEETIDIVLSYAFTFILTLLINVVAAGMNYMYLNIARPKASCTAFIARTPSFSLIRTVTRISDVEIMLMFTPSL